MTTVKLDLFRYRFGDNMAHLPTTLASGRLWITTGNSSGVPSMNSKYKHVRISTLLNEDSVAQITNTSISRYRNLSYIVPFVKRDDQVSFIRTCGVNMYIAHGLRWW